MNITLKIQKWSEEKFVKVSEVCETENFLVISMKDCTSIMMDEINSIGIRLKNDGWDLYSIDYVPTEWTMQIWFSK